MLVLTRKKNQIVMLGDDIKITVLETDADSVKIGVEAPTSIIILRGELYQAVKDENIAALSLQKPSLDLLKKFF